MALGAERGHVVRQVLGQGAARAGAGTVAGVVGALALARVLGSMLVGVSVRDPAVFATVAGVLALVAVVAAWLPARRASRIDPVSALRAE
jgi:ABC-type antimicrobial peptide transport system permease subunit